MRYLLLLLIACGDDLPQRSDAAADASDARPPDGGFDFYGEPCAPPSTPGVVQTCRPELPYPRAYCTPDAVCRPFCSGACAGHETWAFAETAARVCYCEP